MAPIEPAAPLLLSTITVCPRRWVSLSANMRPTMSVAPPAGNGTMRRMVRSGNFAAARAMAGAAAAPQPAGVRGGDRGRPDVARPRLGHQGTAVRPAGALRPCARHAGRIRPALSLPRDAGGAGI